MKLSDGIIKAKYYENNDYIGTQKYYALDKKINIWGTDGAMHVFEKFECFWIKDNIISYLPYLQKKKEFFCVVRIIVNLDYSAQFIIEDGNYNILVNQDIQYTDLKENIKLYLQNDEHRWIVLLPSEY